MTPYLSQLNFLSSYAYYRHSLLGRDAEKTEWARLDAAAHCKTFLDIAENLTDFEPALVIARQFSFAGAHADAPESTPFIIIEETKPKPEYDLNHLFGKKKQTNTDSLSKSAVLSEVSKRTGVTEEKKLIASLQHARTFCRRDGSKYIYDQETINIASKFLKS